MTSSAAGSAETFCSLSRSRAQCSVAETHHCVVHVLGVTHLPVAPLWLDFQGYAQKQSLGITSYLGYGCIKHTGRVSGEMLAITPRGQ